METWAIITGLLAALATFLPGTGTKLRAYGIVGGLLFAGYGLYVANQSSGTYVFPIYGFLLPVVIIGSAIRESLDQKPSPTPANGIFVPARPAGVGPDIPQSGSRFCTFDDCGFRGLRTELAQCPECRFQTRLIDGYGGTTAVVAPPPASFSATVTAPVAVEPLGGARFCTSSECERQGYRTDFPQCSECGFQTRQIDTYGGTVQVRKTPGLPA